MSSGTAKSRGKGARCGRISFPSRGMVKCRRNDIAGHGVGEDVAVGQVVHDVGWLSAKGKEKRLNRPVIGGLRALAKPEADAV